MAGFKGQSSFEFLIILSVAIVIVTAVVVLSQEKLGDVSMLKDQDDAKNAVLDLSSAAKEVYSQGQGARKQVFISLPTSYDSNASQIVNNSIRLMARGTHFSAIESFTIKGSLPRTSGRHLVWVVSEGDYVRIGTSMISLTKNSIYIVMNRNSTANTSLSVQSLWDRQVNVTYALTWAAGNVSASMSPGGPFSLNPAESRDLEFRANADASAIGFYNGEAVFTATDGAGANETARIPITVEVVGLGVGIIPPLSVLPPVWNETLMPGDNVTKTFTVCTGPGSTPTMVTFTPSVLPPGTWVGSTTPLASMPQNTCLQKTLSLSVPPSAPVGLYTGPIVVEGAGVEGASDTISMYVWVGGAQSDTVGPNVTNITRIPTKVYVNGTVQFYISGSDIGRGNNTIRGCDMNVDNTTWQAMLPSDGSYDQMLEAAELNFVNGFSMGNHTVYFRCTDVKNNTGPMANTSVKVMKDFLFISAGPSPNAELQAWLNWVGNHTSSAGFNWKYDWAHDQDLYKAANVTLNYYSVLVLADYHDRNIAPYLMNFTAAGGRVIFLSGALDGGPADVGLTTKSASSGTKNAYIVDNGHYITESFGMNTLYNISTSQNTQVLPTYVGSRLASEKNTSLSTLLGDSGGYIVWGLVDPTTMTGNGTVISTNVFDYALMQSTITPG